MRVPGWTIIIPAKRLPVAKSRLRPTSDDMVLAITLDTIAAAIATGPVGRVLVVTNDGTLAAAAVTIGARIVADAPEHGLNAAIEHGEAHAAGARAALTGDLPALRPNELADALRRAAGAGTGRGYVADHTGTGTTMLAALPGVPLDPHFGPASAAAHAASGALALDGDWPSLRTDVDTPADLAATRLLGLGPRTADRLARMQGTVATYDPDRRDGTLLLDDGTELAFGADAFYASGLRLLRLGQRLRIEHDPAGSIVRLALVTM